MSVLAGVRAACAHCHHLRRAAECCCSPRLPVAVGMPALPHPCNPLAPHPPCVSCVDCTPQVVDPYWADVSCYGYQALQPHQDEVIRAAEQQVERLRAAAAQAHKASSPSHSSS